MGSNRNERWSLFLFRAVASGGCEVTGTECALAPISCFRWQKC